MRDFKIYVVVASLLLIIYVVAQYNKPAPISWQSTLNIKDKIPFGTYILYHELNAIFPGAKTVNINKTVYQTLNNDSLPASNYLIIANKINLNPDDFKQMLKFIKAGNCVFMSAFTWAGYLADTLKIATQAAFEKRSVTLNFTNSQLKQPQDYIFDEDISNQYFSAFDTANAVVLGKNELGKSNFLQYKYGKGSLFICANPHLFTNYNLLNNRGANYVQNALSYLPVKPVIYWDQYQLGDREEDRSPIRVFFSYQSLSRAYYIGLFGLIIFILFEIKRRQRIIPLIEPLKNTTLEFVNVVGRVYYEQRNNSNIAEKKILYLFEHLRSRYYLKTNVLDASFIDTLTHKTGIDKALATQLVNHILYLNVQPRINDNELILLNQLIEQFYAKAG